MLEKHICDSHLEENAVVTKIQEDPNYLFRYTKKFIIISKTDIGPRMNCATNSLSNDKHKMCCLLVDQFTSVPFQAPNKLLLNQFHSFPVSPILALTNHSF